MKPTLKHYCLFFMSFSLAASAMTVTESVVQTVGEWKIVRTTEDGALRCVAKNTSHPNVTLSEKKLTLATKETKDLKKYQVDINGQEALTLRRSDITDASCGCIRIRHVDRLSATSSTFHLAGITEQNKPVEMTLTLIDVPTALEALKKSECALKRGV